MAVTDRRDGVDASPAATDRVAGLPYDVAIKRPAKSVATTNVTRSGEQTIGGVACVADDIVLLTGQTTGSQNGLYTVSTGNWTRTTDANGNNDLRTGTLVFVWGISTPTLYQLTTTGTITIDSTSLTFTTFLPQVNYFVSMWAGGGVFDVSEVLMVHTFTTNVSFAAGLTDSQAKAETASTGTAVLTIKKNSTQVGTITFTASATGVLAMASAQSFTDGDKLIITAPSSIDATLQKVAVTLVGTV